VIFSGADLRRTVLSWSNLRVIDFTGADLRGATITESALCSADLTGADLRGTAFYSTDLTGANLTGCKIDKSTVFKNCILEFVMGEITNEFSNDK